MFKNKVLSEGCVDFIDDAKIEALIKDTPEDAVKVREIIQKSLNKQPLSVEETAFLIKADSPELTEEIFEAARKLKRDVYGNRIVLFAPLYIGNYCINDCKYCSFRRSLRSTVRKTLNEGEVVQQVEALEDSGHKRLILVFGEHPDYSAEFMADTVRKVYSVKHGQGEIRRVNINAAPLDHEGYKIVKNSGIGTYQIFQETYHHETYCKNHPEETHKGDYLWRLDGLSRAFEAGCDDMGIGALFGLYDWRFEVLSLITHSLYLQEKYNVGPHTISFPRLRPAHGIQFDEKYFVNDHDFKRLVAILRLAVPYTGLILTARETAEIRREVMQFGVSQIDAGTRLELGGYSEDDKEEQELKREQFSIGDVRTLDEVMSELIKDGYIPSFCTSCYRLGRTGEHFMEYAIPGFINKFCTPNALLTLSEYLEDYSSDKTREKGYQLIEDEISKIDQEKIVKKLRERLERIKKGERDLYF
ncbi:MAG: [FeFe] hydrogenase H-cluster radical SAM maturase HydG [Lentisphaerae bacterium]|nr:[FeFe] hydrogenase H-cluster radical SAM maturase HydG [Lentisphaerota bacterium]MCP4102245.1 [FeFe] hydrogenase H-cluster radical SAM maturase HydG [Lentisphaerota bacterium]